MKGMVIWKEVDKMKFKENASVCFIPQASTKFWTQLPGDFTQYLWMQLEKSVTLEENSILHWYLCDTLCRCIYDSTKYNIALYLPMLKH